MTTGTIGSTTPVITSTSQTVRYKNWVGSDGKYVIIDGVSRLRFNSYTMTNIETDASKEPAKFFALGGGGLGTGDRVFSSNDTIKINNKIISKVKGHQLNAAVFAAEGSKTIKLVKESILTVGGALVDVKHGNMLRAAQRLGVIKSTWGRRSDGRFFVNKTPSLSPEDIASRWLELQYGWKPLLNDTYEACKAYETLTQPLRTYHYKVSTSRNVRWNSAVSPTLFTCQTSGKLQQKLLLEMTERPGSLPRQLGLEDPLTVAWELMPYSFVLDWFLPIGPYLESAHSAPLLTGRWYKTTSRKFTCGTSSIQNNLNYYGGSRFSGDWLYIVRTVGTGSLNTPLPTFKTLDQSLSPMHIANALALVTSRLSGRGYVYK